jgi:hypothetical protein
MIDSSAGTPGKRTLAVYAVVERENRPNIWLRVGTAFANRDGTINLLLDAFPIRTNRLQIREARFDDGPRAHANGGVPAVAEEEVRP